MVALAAKLGVSPAQLLIRWSLQKGFVPLPKSTNPERQRENFAVFNFCIPGGQGLGLGCPTPPALLRAGTKAVQSSALQWRGPHCFELSPVPFTPVCLLCVSALWIQCPCLMLEPRYCCGQKCTHVLKRAAACPPP